MEKREGVKRVLITSIGGGKIEKKDGEKVLKDYEDTTYIIRKENGDFYTETTSCMPIVIKNAYDIDKTIIIGTTGSMWDNLYEKYLENLKLEEQKDEEYKKSFIDVEIASNKTMSLDKINLEKFNETFKDKVKGIVIKYGVNPKEIFRNFDLIIKIQEEFNEEEEYEVYLDITHSFRSNAFWMFLVMTYFTDVSNKNIKIAGITYGMYEAKSENVTPIVILKPFLEILNWIKGASELKQYGNSYYILENLKNNNYSLINKNIINYENKINFDENGNENQNFENNKNNKSEINQVDYIICNFDTVNYLKNEKEFLKFIEKCNRNLKKGGYLIFDAVTEDIFEEIFENDIFLDEEPEYTSIWRHEKLGKRKHLVEIDLFIRENKNDNLFRKYNEVQNKFIYEPEWIVETVQNKGFEIFDTASNPEFGESRIFFVLKKL